MDLKDLKEEDLCFSKILATRKDKLYLTIFSAHPRYGGPEEGGWWYDYEITELSIEVNPNSKKRNLRRLANSLIKKQKKRIKWLYGRESLRYLRFYYDLTEEPLPVPNNIKPTWC